MRDPIRVLHVDDESAFGELVAEMLSHEGEHFTVETVVDAGAALDLLDERHVDCIVSDYAMPGTDGIELLETVRAKRPDLPFILFTGQGSEEVASEAISAGATDYLRKGSGRERYELLANRIENAVEQYRSMRRADDLDRIRTLASDVNQLLVRADSRAEAETGVCEAIADVEPYAFAWIGDVTPESGCIEPRATAGGAQEYLSAITITADERPTGQGPAGRAIREQRVAVSQNIEEDPAFEPWRGAAIERGVRSTAAVPLIHDDQRYGVLGVYSSDPRPFDDDERELLAEIGTDIAHALYSFETDAKLRSERDRREALFENGHVPVITAEPSPEGDAHVINDINSAFEDVFGYDAEEVIGEDAGAVLVPDEGRDRHATLRERVENGETITTEVERLTADGHREFVLHVIPYGVEDDPVDGVYAWYTDVTDRHERKRELRAFREAVENAGHAIFWTDVEGTIEYVNPAFESQTGYDAEEAIGETPSILKSGEHDESFYADLWETILGGNVWENELVNERADGERYVIEQTIAPIANDDGIERLVAINRDVTDRRERIARLQDKANLLDQLLEQLPVSLYVKDTDGRHLYVSDHHTDPEQVFGKTDLDRLDDEELAREAYADDMYVVETGESIINKEEYKETTGEWMLTSKVPWYDEDGQIKGLIGVTRLITERKEYEREIERQNERLGEFTSVVSHDLRNPLSVARGALELARQDCPSEHHEDVANALERMETLIEDLLTLAREGKHVKEIESVALDAAVEDCWRNVATDDATLRVETSAQIQADRSCLPQLLENLMGNAVEHGGETVTVTVGDLEDGFYVADDGPGIQPGERDRVFESGYSTSDAGSGMGLQIVEQIATGHGWEVTVAASDDGGARFEITGVERTAE